MSKMRYFSKTVSKFFKNHWGLSTPSVPLPLFWCLKLRDLAKFWFFKLIMTKLNSKYQ